MDEELDRLNDLLNGVPLEREGMTIGELDGYVTALIVSPEVVLPSEWLPGVWGGDDAFGSLAEVEELVTAVLAHYNRIARELAEDPDAYAPVLEVDPNGGDLLWGPWVNGFERAMGLRADAWEAVAFGDDEDAAASVSMILAMNAWDHGDDELTEEDEDEIDDPAPSLIPALVRHLYARTNSQGVRSGVLGGAMPVAELDPKDPPIFGRRVGRNDDVSVRIRTQVQTLLRSDVTTRV